MTYHIVLSFRGSDDPESFLWIDRVAARSASAAAARAIRNLKAACASPDKADGSRTNLRILTFDNEGRQEPHTSYLSDTVVVDSIAIVGTSGPDAPMFLPVPGEGGA